VDPLGDLAQLVEYVGQPGGHLVQLRAQLGRLRRHRRPGDAQPQREGDQLLLGAVVQIALDAAPGLVGGGDDARPGGGERGLGLGVGDGGGNQVGEAGQPRLGVHRQRRVPQ